MLGKRLQLFAKMLTRFSSNASEKLRAILETLYKVIPAGEAELLLANKLAD